MVHRSVGALVGGASKEVEDDTVTYQARRKNFRPNIAVICAALAPVVVLSLIPAPTANGATTLPEEGTLCAKGEIGRIIQVRKVTDKKRVKAELQATKSKATGTLICQVYSWPSEEESFDWPFGQWVYEPLSTRLQVSPSATKPPQLNGEIANIPCRLEWESPINMIETVSLSHDRRDAAYQFLATDRPARGLLIHVADSPDAVSAADLAAWNAIFQRALVGAQNYWTEQSDGRFGLQVDIAPGVYVPEQIQAANQESRLSRTLASLDGQLNFQGYDFVIKVDGSADVGGSTVFLGSLAPNLDGESVGTVLQFSRRDADQARYEYLLKHEIGHALGLPDYYGRPITNEVHNRFVGNHTLMGRGSTYLTGYEKWILGWLPDQRVLCVSKSSQGESVLDSVDADRLTDALVIYRLSADRAVVVENRTESLPATLPDGQHLFVYMVNASSRGAIRAGTGAETQNIYSRRGELGSDDSRRDAYVYHQSEPPMVTYRSDGETLRRVVNAPEPITAASMQAWLAQINNGAIQSNIALGPYLTPNRNNVIAQPWFGLRIVNAPVAANGADGPRLRFTWNFAP